MVVIIPFLMLTGISYDSYFKGSEVLNDLLQPAVVALAYPLYEQLHQIRALEIDHHHLFYRQRGCDGDGDFCGIVDGRFTGNRRVNPAEISHHAYCNGSWRQYWRYSGNQRSCVIFVGILGAVFGHTLLNAMRIRTKAARGLAMGTASHALGTARCAELDYQEGAFSSLALVLCGIITSLIAPFLFPIILAVMG